MKRDFNHEYPVELALVTVSALLTFHSLLFFRQKGFEIKWIDDNHVLGLFSHPIAG